jgi:monofunctional glycosyltransferase
MKKSRPVWLQHLLRLVTLLLICAVSLQGVWLLRIALMNVLDPQSTTFERSEIWRLLSTRHEVPWAQQWVDRPELGTAIQQAVIASEDSLFVDHGGVEWDAIKTAWLRNRVAEKRAEKRASKTGKPVAPKIVGGSTITQQLAKNLFLSGERTAARKAQELLITLALEALLSKERILEIYLNNVEWGEGVFGAQAAAQHYFGRDAARLSDDQAARLAVLLPAPKRYERNIGSLYVQGRAAVIASRMGAVDIP